MKDIEMDSQRGLDPPMKARSFDHPRKRMKRNWRATGREEFLIADF